MASDPSTVTHNQSRGPLAAPRFERLGPIEIAGLARLLTAETRHEIPLLWQRFARWAGKIPNRSGAITYGVIRNSDKGRGFYYLAGVEVSCTTSLPDDLRVVSLPEQEYAVFTHVGPVSDLFQTMCAIYTDWLPQATRTLLDAPCFERYGEDFNPATGQGTIEIWLPVESIIGSPPTQ